jgi:hypothetical protein
MPVKACPGRDPGPASRFIVSVTSKKLDSGMRRNDKSGFLLQTNFNLGQKILRDRYRAPALFSPVRRIRALIIR